MDIFLVPSVKMEHAGTRNHAFSAQNLKIVDKQSVKKPGDPIKMPRDCMETQIFIAAQLSHL